MLSSASAYAESVDQVMIYIIAVSVILLLGITVAMIYFVIKYNRKRHPKAKQIEGNALLETIWIVVPLVLVMSMFWYGYVDYYELRKVADQALTVQVQAQMWKWNFEYPNGKRTDTLYIPVDETTKLEMTSIDVNHSLYIPAFRLKEDVLQGRKTYLILQPIKIGSYDIACAEYCGLNHAYMYTKLHVLSKEDFEKWMNEGTEKEEEKTPADTLNGEKISLNQ